MNNENENTERGNDDLDGFETFNVANATERERVTAQLICHRHATIIFAALPHDEYGDRANVYCNDRGAYSVRRIFMTVQTLIIEFESLERVTVVANGCNNHADFHVCR